jgi:2,4-didehydro-3-deoxy-L-rhamnonate hydrolase
MSTDIGPQFALGTFSTAGGMPFAALVLGNSVAPLEKLSSRSRATWAGSSGAISVLSLLGEWDENLALLREIVASLPVDEGQRGVNDEAFVPISSLRVHPPVNLPRQVFCAGANYKKHVIDLIVDQAMGSNKDTSVEERRAQAAKMMDDRAAHGVPFVFSKPISAITGAFDPVILPRAAQQPDWELELAIIIGKPARHVSRDRALDYVAGYTIVNDITNRDLVFRKDIGAMGADWLMAKGSPTYLPTGPFLVPAAFVDDPQNLRITLKLNGQMMQDESTADMIFEVARIIEFLSANVQLWPGDLIATGSPAGNGTHYNRYLTPGDLMEGSITGLGTQRNRCVAEGAETDGVNRAISSGQ